MSLYGYGRKTTPGLDSIRDDLHVFKNIVSSRPYTIEVLQQVLTFADQEHPDLYLTKPSLMNMMKQAGYKSYWITNQQTMTERNTMLTTFSKQTDVQVYLNNRASQDSSQFDSAVFEPFKEALKDPAPKKFIVIHLLGAHMKYRYRYPSDYERFVDRTGVPDWLKDSQLLSYNQYDNALLFNDHVVKTLVDQFAETKSNGFLVYFADHGEDVFDSAEHNFNGRNESSPTYSMYAVPFLMWSSEQWKASHGMNFRKYLDREYSTMDFIHTWSDLAGLSYTGFDPSRSVVNEKFAERPLWVGDPAAPKALKDLRTLAR
jgi:heptose-I-phosphate ethanolaminephosphotransferase